MTRFSEEWLTAHYAKQGKDTFQTLIDSRGFNPHESVDHAAVAGYLNALDIFWLHVPNEGKRSPKQGARLKQLGLLPGAADLIIFDAPPLHPCAKGVCIEMKRQKGEKASEEQLDFLEKMERRGWLCKVCHGANEAIEYLRSMGWRIDGVSTK